ncbi:MULTISPECIES: hypothetical protein [unclassified Streptomyces]|uniref:hypothetical protein n=1 Tax=Streptomyces sp. NPDC127129 TaxID=3345373 RepID=UPI00362ABFDE
MNPNDIPQLTPRPRDPLSVTTSDGTVWVRSAITRTGRGLYTIDGVHTCPEHVMATLDELAEHGLRPQQTDRDDANEDVTPQVQKLRGILAGQRAALEDPHDSDLHHDYALGRDFPEHPGGSW